VSVQSIQMSAQDITEPLPIDGPDGSRPRQRRRRCCTCPRRWVDQSLDQLVAALVDGRVEDLRRPGLRLLLRRAKRRLILSLCVVFANTPVGAYTLIRGTQTLTVTINDERCAGPLHIWLLGVVSLQISSISMPFLLFMLAFWVFAGATFMDGAGHKLGERCPEIKAFRYEAVALEVASLSCLLLAIGTWASSRPAMRQIRTRLGTNGAGTAPEVIELIESLAPDQVPAEEECCVCLRRRDEDEDLALPRWSRLACGHRFHEECLLEWLNSATRCPVCRDNLHDSYSSAFEMQDR